MAPRGRRFVVLGSGGHGRVVADLVRSLAHEVVGYADADERKLGTCVDAAGACVMLSQEELLACAGGERGWPFDVDAVALGIGDNATRGWLAERIGSALLPPLVHPGSWISHYAHVGAGTVVLAGAVVNNGARLGDGVIINSRATIEHDCRVAASVHISPGATLCGCVSIGRAGWVAAGAVIVPGCVVGARAIVGAGAVVIRDVPDDTTVVGNPARPISRAAVVDGPRSYVAPALPDVVRSLTA